MVSEGCEAWSLPRQTAHKARTQTEWRISGSSPSRCQQPNARRTVRGLVLAVRAERSDSLGELSVWPSDQPWFLDCLSRTCPAGICEQPFWLPTLEISLRSSRSSIRLRTFCL